MFTRYTPELLNDAKDLVRGTSLAKNLLFQEPILIVFFESGWAKDFVTPEEFLSFIKLSLL
jgi:hypothetical protein